MALKKDLATLTDIKALVEKATGKRKRLMVAVREKKFYKLMRGMVTVKEAQAPNIEKVREVLSTLLIR